MKNLISIFLLSSPSERMQSLCCCYTDGQVEFPISQSNSITLGSGNPIVTNRQLGSFLEFIPLLSLMRDTYTPANLPYHFIVTSMPGYGFSTPPPTHRELDMLEVPMMLNQVMLNLGFGGGYIAHGGDIGSRIARILAVKHEACKGIHFIPHVITQSKLTFWSRPTHIRNTQETRNCFLR